MTDKLTETGVQQALRKLNPLKAAWLDAYTPFKQWVLDNFKPPAVYTIFAVIAFAGGWIISLQTRVTVLEKTLPDAETRRRVDVMWLWWSQANCEGPNAGRPGCGNPLPALPSSAPIERKP